MASFSVEVYKVKVEPHGNADSLELAVIGEYRSIIRKGQYKDGDLVAYIPEAAMVPQTLLTEMGLEGRLAGSEKNRVKAIKLRGVMSQGLVYPARIGWIEGQDVTEELGITKYEPRIPAQFAGEQGSLKPREIHGLTQTQGTLSVKFDIENFKKYNTLFEEGEEVVITEKIHGSFSCYGAVPEDYHNPDLLQGKYAVSSKGLISKGIFLKDNDANANNTYIKAAKKFRLGEIADLIRSNLNGRPNKYKSGRMGDVGPVWIMGEVYGRSVQGEMAYGVESGDVSFRAFDIKVGGQYMDYDLFLSFMNYHGIPTVPLLYRGSFSKEKLLELTSGKETVTGNGMHIREGVVVKPVHERVDHKIGRAILKSVSDAYLEKSTGEEIQ